MRKISVIFCLGMFFFCIFGWAFLNYEYPRKYREEIYVYSKQYNVNPAMVASVIDIESGYDTLSISNAKAVGLMQLLPTTAFDMAGRLGLEITYDDLFFADINIRLGTYYLRYLIDMFDGIETNALSAYNWGLKNVQNWLAMGNKNNVGEVTDIPVNETQKYITKYKKSYFVYSKIYNY